ANLTEKQLSDPPFRHNIENLLDKAIKCGLSLSTNTRRMITLLTEAHTKHWPRYPIRGSSGVVLIYECEPDANKLFKAVFDALGPPPPLKKGKASRSDATVLALLPPQQHHLHRHRAWGLSHSCSPTGIARWAG